MEKLKLYILDSYNELMHKVTWPSMASLQSTTVVVLIASAVLALLIFLMDLIAKTGMTWIYGV